MRPSEPPFALCGPRVALVADGVQARFCDVPAVEAALRSGAAPILLGALPFDLLSTLLLSAGVPLLLGGDELGRTQRGNNNAYCQDNEITWFDWSTVLPHTDHFAATLLSEWGIGRGRPPPGAVLYSV